MKYTKHKFYRWVSPWVGLKIFPNYHYLSVCICFIERPKKKKKFKGIGSVAQMTRLKFPLLHFLAL